jgi:hypothetical protein
VVERGHDQRRQWDVEFRQAGHVAQRLPWFATASMAAAAACGSR